MVMMTTEWVRFLRLLMLQCSTYFVIKEEKHRDDVFLWPLSGVRDVINERHKT
jgi:hypothetical protein